MLVLNGIKELTHPIKNPILTIGNFDGVHLGHQALLQQVVEEAKKKLGTSICYTFKPDPSKIIAPNIFHPLISTYESKIQLIAAEGIDVIIQEPFTREFSNLAATIFLDNNIFKQIAPKHIYIGSNFHFGHGRSGSPDLLKAQALNHGIHTTIVQPIMKYSETISSSQIRKCINQGDISKANLFLGRYFFIRGIVVKGDQRGKAIGIPTANIQTSNELIPSSGVYTSLTVYKNKAYRSVTNIGTNPTFMKTKPLTIETHLLEFNLDIYGENIEIQFIKRLREEIKFSSMDELVKQIRKDIEASR